RPTFEVNRIALAGAEATMDDLSYSKQSLRTIWNEIDRVAPIYRDLGFDVTDTHTNFMFVDVKTDANQLSEELLKKGIIIRPCTPRSEERRVGKECRSRMLPDDEKRREMSMVRTEEDEL